MDDLNLAELWEPVERDGRVYIRVRRDITRSPRVRAFRDCVGDATRGRRYRTGDAATDEAEVRSAFRQAVQECAIYDKRFPSDARYERRSGQGTACEEADRLAHRLEALEQRRRDVSPEREHLVAEQQDATYRLFQDAHERCLAEER